MKTFQAMLLLFLSAIGTIALAHSGPEGTLPLADIVRERSIDIALWAGGAALLLMLIAMWFKQATEETKKLLFALIVMSIVGPTGYFIWSTINLNVQSEANGPVHWHTDFQIYACGEKLPPPNPQGRLSNKTGTPVLHQHADDRLHVEGVVIEQEEVELDRFFEVQGGTLTENAFRVPTGDTVKTYLNGDYCPGGEQGKWNVFLYRVDERTMTATQTKLTDYVHYVPAPHELPPLIDCLIFEFGPETAYTDHLCNFHQIAVNKGELKVEIPAKSEGGVPLAGGEQEVVDTSDWQTYQNDSLGISFLYPTSVRVETKRGWGETQQVEELISLFDANSNQLLFSVDHFEAYWSIIKKNNQSEGYVMSVMPDTYNWMMNKYGACPSFISHIPQYKFIDLSFGDGFDVERRYVFMATTVVGPTPLGVVYSEYVGPEFIQLPGMGGMSETESRNKYIDLEELQIVRNAILLTLRVQSPITLDCSTNPKIPG